MTCYSQNLTAWEAFKAGWRECKKREGVNLHSAYWEFMEQELNTTTSSTTTSSATISKAQDLVRSMFRGNQHTWPDDSEIFVPVWKIRGVMELLGAALTINNNAVGARRKDV